MSVLRDFSTYPRTVELELAIRALEDSMRQVRTQLEEIQRSFFEVTYVAPSKPRNLMIRYADGTSWNPGGGAGLYQFKDGLWTKL